MAERNAILESIGDAFFAVDKNWMITYWNNTSERVLGKTKAGTIGQNLWAAHPYFTDKGFSEHLKQAVALNQHDHFEIQCTGKLSWYEVSAYPSEGGLSVYMKEITDRKSAETQLLQLNDELRSKAKDLAFSNAELEQFAYVASHDLQEPLRMVTSFMGLLEKKYGNVIDDKGKQYIHFAIDGGKRMHQIILELLEFSRVGRTEDKMELVDLNLFEKEIKSLYRSKIEEKKAVIKFGNLPILQTLKAPLRQVFQNLVGNALKYQQADRNPVVNVSGNEFDNYWEFTVADNGIGIEKENYDSIFIIFKRLHNYSDIKGTGLGLAMTKKIIEQLGGKIWVSSEPGKGSAFTFTIPKVDRIS
jgi:PAS domain S-box-containing protein